MEKKEGYEDDYKLATIELAQELMATDLPSGALEEKICRDFPEIDINEAIGIRRRKKEFRVFINHVYQELKGIAGPDLFHEIQRRLQWVSHADEFLGMELETLNHYKRATEIPHIYLEMIPEENQRPDAQTHLRMMGSRVNVLRDKYYQERKKVKPGYVDLENPNLEWWSEEAVTTSLHALVAISRLKAPNLRLRLLGRIAKGRFGELYSSYYPGSACQLTEVVAVYQPSLLDYRCDRSHMIVSRESSESAYTQAQNELLVAETGRAIRRCVEPLNNMHTCPKGKSPSLNDAKLTSIIMLNDPFVHKIVRVGAKKIIWARGPTIRSTKAQSLAA